jgi:hypothetical protein
VPESLPEPVSAATAAFEAESVSEPPVVDAALSEPEPVPVEETPIETMSAALDQAESVDELLALIQSA